VPATPAPAKSDAELTGKEIFDRVVENRFASMIQTARLVSGNRAKRTFETKFQVYWKDYEEVPNRDKAESKTLIRYLDPFDMRHTSYLAVSKEGGAEDHWVYLPSRGQIRRINLRGDSIYGTDFSFEDVVPREAAEFAYERLADTEFRGVDVWVVQLFPEEIATSEYSRIQVFVDKQRHVVLRSRYWDEAGVEVKEFRAPPELVREYDGVFVPTRAVMKHLLNDSATTLVIDELEANPAFSQETFDLRRLEGR
jgi:hypothetical protein